MTGSQGPATHINIQLANLTNAKVSIYIANHNINNCLLHTLYTFSM